MDTNEAQRPLVIGIIITFIIAFWLGFFVGWLITGRDTAPAMTPSDTNSDISKEEEREEGETGSANNTISASGEHKLKAANQFAGNRAQIDSVTLAQEGWIVVHEDRDSRPGNILGAAWLPAGSHESVTVDLLRGMESGRRYYAILHGETKGEGEGTSDHVFDLETDLPLQDAQGNLMLTAFEIIASPN